MSSVQAIILAAGKSTRFNTGNTKLIAPICGQPLIVYITRLLELLNIEQTVIVGYQKEAVITALEKAHGSRIGTCVQSEQRGTGHAIACSRERWHADTLLIMNGDMPLVIPDIITELLRIHITSDAVMSFVTAHHEEKSGHGRVVQTPSGISIVEAKDFTGDVYENPWINAGIYAISREFLEQYIDRLQPNNNAQELYITDLARIASEAGLMVSTTCAPFDRIRGINTMQELWAVEQIQRADLIKYWMEKGVRFSTPQNVHIDRNVIIGAGSFIGSGVHLLNGTHIGANCTVHEFVTVDDSIVADEAIVYPFTIITQSRVDHNAQVGPFAHVRMHSSIGHHAAIGNFVEITRSEIGAHTKIKHLSYIGDATLGTNVNIGAGTITCNHDGVHKHRTTIADNVFIGSNNTLIAPITIGEGAYTAAGSTITNAVPADALGIGRARQVNKEGYATILRKRIANMASLFTAARKTDTPETESLS